MWNYIRLYSDNSPMAEILSRCSNKSNLRLVIYHLDENHVECATVSPDEVRKFNLGDTARVIREDAENGAHAVLAFDVKSGDVYLIDSTPELPVASAVLLCVVTELLNGCVQPRQCKCGRPENCENDDKHPRIEDVVERNQLVKRDACGRFVRKEEVDEPWKNPPTMEGADASTVLTRRFRLGRH